MRFSHVWALCLHTVSINAFRDTSPFFAFSTSKLPNLDEYARISPNVATGPRLSSQLEKDFKNCVSDAYIFVNLPGVSAGDFEVEDVTPELRQKISKEDERIRSAVLVPDVTKGFDANALKQLVVKECGASEMKLNALNGHMSASDSFPQVVTINLPFLPLNRAERTQRLFEHDSFLGSVISNLESRAYTVVFTTTPASDQVRQELERQHPVQLLDYDTEISLHEVLHTDLKRDMHAYSRRQNSSEPDERGLFEKYNFLSGAIYMGIIAALLFISIVYVGISAVASVEVSYAAFSREMGPAAQKKQQQ